MYMGIGGKLRGPGKSRSPCHCAERHHFNHVTSENPNDQFVTCHTVGRRKLLKVFWVPIGVRLSSKLREGGIRGQDGHEGGHHWSRLTSSLLPSALQGWKNKKSQWPLWKSGTQNPTPVPARTCCMPVAKSFVPLTSVPSSVKQGSAYTPCPPEPGPGRS